MNKTYLVFFNRTGNRKLALELDDVSSVSDIDEKLANVINCLCERNGYTFSFYDDDTITDKTLKNKSVLKNIPIISFNKCF